MKFWCIVVNSLSCYGLTLWYSAPTRFILFTCSRFGHLNIDFSFSTLRVCFSVPRIKIRTLSNFRKIFIKVFINLVHSRFKWPSRKCHKCPFDFSILASCALPTQQSSLYSSLSFKLFAINEPSWYKIWHPCVPKFTTKLLFTNFFTDSKFYRSPWTILIYFVWCLDP